MKLLLPLLLALAFTAGSVAQAAPEKKRPTAGKAVKAKPAKAKASKVKSAKVKAAAKTREPVKPARVVAPVDYSGEQVNFGEWKAVSDFADDISLRHGFPREELRALISQIRYIDSAVQLVKPAPPGKPKNMNAVRDLMIEPVRVNAGVKFWNEQAAVLARAENEFGVPAEIIVGIIGIETVYGRNTGRFRILDVLTTLGFAYPEAPNQAARMAFFRGELENALVLARRSGVDPFTLLGSFAGAIGMPQFMPGSVLAYGVDYDGDGNVDLRNSTADAIGSVASFLVQHGWKRNEGGPLVYPANVAPGRNWEAMLGQGLAAKYKLPELLAAGVATPVPPPGDRMVGLIDLQNGADATEYWLATNNFFAITQYNRSYFYAMSVIELGRAVTLARGAAAVIPAETL
jgi:membrane-bound lytic murein transglycosylase B